MKTKHLLSIYVAGMLLLQPSNISAVKSDALPNILFTTAVSIWNAYMLYKIAGKHCTALTSYIHEITTNHTAAVIKPFLETRKPHTTKKECLDAAQTPLSIRWNKNKREFFCNRHTAECPTETPVYLTRLQQEELLPLFKYEGAQLHIEDLAHFGNNGEATHLENPTDQQKVKNILTQANLLDLLLSKANASRTKTVSPVITRGLLKLTTLGVLAGALSGSLFTYAIVKS